MTTPHILTITGHVTDGDIDEREFVLSCPGVEAGRCGGYRPCTVPDCPSSDADTFDGGAAHGVNHVDIDGRWMTATGECFYTGDGADGLASAVEWMEDFGEKLALAAGEYPVEPEYDGDGVWQLSLVKVSA